MRQGTLRKSVWTTPSIALADKYSWVTCDAATYNETVVCLVDAMAVHWF